MRIISITWLGLNLKVVIFYPHQKLPVKVTFYEDTIQLQSFTGLKDFQSEIRYFGNGKVVA